MRATLDVDIVADMQSGHIPALVAALAGEFYADAEMMQDAIERRGSFNLIHYATAFKVDIFIRKVRSFDQMQFERRVRSIVVVDTEQSIYMAAPKTRSSPDSSGIVLAARVQIGNGAPALHDSVKYLTHQRGNAILR